jgi:short-subunit dehydrogenase
MSMAITLKNKRILVTGSTDGLGRLLAIELAKKGSNLIIHGKSQEKVSKVLEELKTIGGKHAGIVCDFNYPDKVCASFNNIKDLDILINNAGVWLEGETVEASPEKIIELINVNLASYLLVTRSLLPILLKSEFGQVLNVVSVAGIEIPSGFFHTIYTATKYGLQGFSEAIEKEFDNKTLRIMGFYPGGMETDIFKKSGNNYKKHEAWMFDPMESVEAIEFMLTRSPKVNIKRLDLINHLQE